MIDRFHYRRVIRRGRRSLRYPRFWAALTGETIPSSGISGKQSELAGPESIEFTPSKGHMAVSNSAGNSITFHRKETSSKCSYSSEPYAVICDQDHLDYVHDISFSADGSMMAAAARNGNMVPVYFRGNGEESEFDSKPCWVIRGEKTRLSFPSGVAFHPSQSWLAVANRGRSSGITIFNTPGLEDAGDMNIAPLQCITEEDLLKLDLAPPHDVAFSRDGKYLLSTHKHFFRGEKPWSKSALAIFRCAQPGKPGLEMPPARTMSYGYDTLHSADIHPSGQYIAVTDEECVKILQNAPGADSFREISQINFQSDAFRKTKGIAYTPDGNQIALSTAFNEILFYPSEIGMEC